MESQKQQLHLAIVQKAAVMNKMLSHSTTICQYSNRNGTLLIEFSKESNLICFTPTLHIVLGLLQTFRFEILRRVSQNGKFVINSVQYPRGGTMVAKILDFMLFESLEKALSRSFSSPKLFLES